MNEQIIRSIVERAGAMESQDWLVKELVTALVTQPPPATSIAAAEVPEFALQSQIEISNSLREKTALLEAELADFKKHRQEVSIPALIQSQQRRAEAGLAIQDITLTSQPKTLWQAMSNEEIQHLWDTHVGVPTEKIPLTNMDVVWFARALLHKSGAIGRDALLSASEIRMLHDFPYLQEFHSKHSIGPMLAPSCLCCGQKTEPAYLFPDASNSVAIQHAELPGIVICKSCRDAALSQPSDDGRGKS